MYTKDTRRVLGPSRHLSILYTAFVFMQLFNQINSRVLSNHINIFKGAFDNYIAIIVFSIEVGLQVILTEFGGTAFSLSFKGLTWQQWFISIAFSFGTWIVRIILTFIDFGEKPEIGGKEELEPKKSGLLRRSNSRIVSEKMSSAIGAVLPKKE